MIPVIGMLLLLMLIFLVEWPDLKETKSKKDTITFAAFLLLSGVLGILYALNISFHYALDWVIMIFEPFHDWLHDI